MRVVLSPEEKRAINRALNERPFEAPPSAIDAFNALIPVQPAHGRQVNWNGNSENLFGTQYATDAGLSRVSGDTIRWQGITLQRLTHGANFAAALRDARAADYQLVPGRRYIVSAIVCAPYAETDSFGVKGPWNRFSWMWTPTDGTSHGHGAKLIGPVPTGECWTVATDGVSAWRVQ